jgi:hypothetical protein
MTNPVQLTSSNSNIHINYFDPVINPNVNAVGLDVRKLGIYSGGYLSNSGDNVTTVVSPFTCEIGDSAATALEQIRCQTTSNTSVTTSTTNTLVVLRWTYATNSTTNYPYLYAIVPGAQLATDVIIGKVVYAGSVWTSTDYTLRTNPNIQDVFLKVEPTVAASMNVRIRAGRVNYGSSNLNIIDQLSPTLSAPGSNSWIALIQITTSGVIKNPPTYGSSSVSPTAPDYGGLVTLAEVTLTSGQTTITASSIKDVRAFNAGYPGVGQFVDLISAQNVDGVKTFGSFSITPSSAPTTSYQVANKKYVDDRDAATLAAVPAQVGFGDWVSKSKDTVYQAATDGFVTAYTTFTNVAQMTITGFSDANNPPTTVRAIQDIYTYEVNTDSRYSWTITFPVKKGHYYKVTSTHTVTMQWISLGS